MNTQLKQSRTKQIINYLNNLEINSSRLKDIIKVKNHEILAIFDEALTHSSANKEKNHEKLEFYGDAVLRLAASEFIENKFHSMSVGKRSELRSQIVSDEWLTKLGKEIKIEKIIILGPKAMGDEYSKNTIIAECLEAFIGALYKCFDSICEINIWLDQYWERDADLILKSPYKFNAKSALQEWCQAKKINLPEYKIIEKSTDHGDPKRFFCEVFIEGKKEAESYGQSHKKAEKNAAKILIETIYKKKK